MKRFILIGLFLSFFGFSSAWAYDACVQVNPFVPCSFGQYNFDSYITASHWDSTPGYTIFYLSEFAVADHGVNQNPNIIDVYRTGGYFNIYVFDGTSLQGGASAPYPITAWLEAGIPQKILKIINNPQAGGGVSDYPAGENIYCGIDGYTRCQASYPLNTQVTLDAYPNEGYEFSHWEINGLAMADVDGSIDVTMDETKNVVAVFKPIFRFPLSGYTSTTASITAVMDHSLSGGFYTADGRNNEIEAFNGLIANGTQHSYGGNIYCYDTAETNPFPGLNYAYGSEVCYDEHPGFDFAVVNGTNVLAPFAGKLYWATTDLVNGNPGTFGTFYIDHENGYTTWFLHCSGLTQGVLDQIQQKGYADVAKGDHIAESGNQGSGAYHLHFEVRKDGVDDEHVIDPYGWELWE